VSHVVLLGDSIFDNASYVRGSPDVVEQLRSQLPGGWLATLCAVDGATASGVPRQLARVPSGGTHLIVSVGGNDALGSSGLLRQPSRPLGQALAELAANRERFWQSYRDMLAAVLKAGKPTVVCTVYDAVPNLPAEGAALLSVFNDVILREAARARLPVLDLRLVCTDAADYAAVSPIEPSAAGGMKIARAIAGLLTTHDFTGRRCVVYGA
jgi:lysophospholipase L1-like esterase